MNVSLSKRPVDFIFIGFFIIAFVVVYIIDYEQIAIPNYFEFKKNGQYPIFPPKYMVDLVHWWGENYDPILLARPVWYKVMIWWDVLYFGPYYLFAIYGFIKGREWIRFCDLFILEYLV